MFVNHLTSLYLYILIYRLADEVEQRTDVRKSGMQGFYSNLLTKNVALGGDVDANAVSVYTAGSSRQTQLLKEHTIPTPIIESKDDEGPTSRMVDNQTIRSKLAEQNVVSEVNKSSEAASVSHKLTQETSSTSLKTSTSITSTSSSSAGIGLSIPPVAVGTATVQKKAMVEEEQQVQQGGVQVDKNVQILSAKDRYLARKRALENPSDA